MADSNCSDSGRGDSIPGPQDPDFASLLADALRSERELLPGDAPTHADDIARALAEVGEIDLDSEASAARLLEDEALRGDIVDIAAAAELDDAVLPDTLREAALAAFDAGAAPVVPLRAAGGVRTEPLRAAAFRPIPFVRTWLSAAALVIVALGAVVFMSATDDAEAGLQLSSLKRVDLAGSVRMSSTEPRYFAKLGHVFTPGEDELLSFGFGRDALLVVGGGDAVRVTRSDLLASVAGVEADAVLRLESGEARLATRDEPVLLQLGSAGILVLTEGAAHAAFHASSQQPVVALAEESVARFHRARGAPVPLTGPGYIHLSPDGPQKHGTPARTLFRDLEFFGGPLPAETQVRAVSPRLWKIAEGKAARGRTDIRIEGESVRLTWRAPEILHDATTLRVALRAPKGTTVSVPQLGSARVNGATSETEPGVATVEIPLPRGWYARLEGRTLPLLITVPAGGAPNAARAWFDGVSLVLGTTNEIAIDRLAGRLMMPPEAGSG